jgi:hypothetical protein
MKTAKRLAKMIKYKKKSRKNDEVVGKRPKEEMMNRSYDVQKRWGEIRKQYRSQ